MNDDNQAGWNSLQLGDVITYHNSGVYKSKELYGDQGENIIGISQLYSSLFVDGEVYKRVPLTLAEQKKYTLHENDLLYGESSLVRSGIARTVCVTSDGEGTAFAWHTRRLKIDQRKAYSPFLAYLLELDETRAKVESVATQTALTGITTKDYFGIPLRLPTLNCQRKVAKILATVDNLIVQTQNLIDKYTAVKQGMMADLFSRGIDLSGTPETNKNYRQLRPSYEEAPELYQETEIGWVPKDWGINTIGEFSEVKGGKRLPAGEPFANEVTPYPYLRVTDMVDGWIDDTNLEYVSSEIEAIISRYKIYESDIYVTIAGTLGLFGRIPSHLNGAQLTENAARISSFDTSKYNPDYLCSYLRSDKLIPQLYKAIGVGAGVPKLALYQIEQFKIPVPPFREQEELVKRIASSTELIAKEKKYLNKLKLKKKGLMQDLLTGKVKV